MVLRMEKRIAEMTHKLCDKILTRTGHREPFNISTAYSNMITDVVSEATFGDRGFGLLDRPGFKLNFREPTKSGLRFMFIFRFFPTTRVLIKLLAW